MSKLVGGIVLALGVGGLGYVGSQYQAKEMETRVTAGAMGAALNTVHGISTEVSGRDIRVSGIANGVAEHDSIVAAMNAVDGRRVVTDDLTVLPDVSPFNIHSIKSADTQSYDGNIPNVATRGALAAIIGDEAVGGLEMAAGAPDDAWGGLAVTGLTALDGLVDGEMTLNDRALTITGRAATPPQKDAADAMFATLPDGYSADVSITSILPLADPFAMGARKTGDEQTFAGAVPSETDRATLASVIGEGADSLVPAYGAPDDNWTAVAAKGLSALGMLDDGEMTLSGTELSVKGSVRTPPEKAAVEAMLAGLPDAYTTNVAIMSDLKLASPFVIAATKATDDLTLKGSVPDREGMIALPLFLGNVSPELTMAYGAPDENWTRVARDGISALAELEEGSMTLSDTALTLTGVAMVPADKAAAEALIAEMPEGYTKKVDIQVLDDGKPVAYTVFYHPVTGASVDGKLPMGTSKEDVAKGLGLSTISGNPVVSRIGSAQDGDGLTAQLAALSGWLPEMETFSLVASGGKTEIFTQFAPGVDADLVKQSLAEGFGSSATIEAVALKLIATDGDVRESSASGAQVFSGGFWLPAVAAFEVSAESCSAAAGTVLTNSKINFLSGSANLDGKSVRTINSLAAVMLNCADQGDLVAEIGGHTDSSGGLDLNMRLSADRAQAVVAALVARGISADILTAQGYGPNEPIATNDTDEGKAANRRTTVRWSVPIVPAPTPVEPAPVTTQTTDPVEASE